MLILAVVSSSSVSLGRGRVSPVDFGASCCSVKGRDRSSFTDLRKKIGAIFGKMKMKAFRALASEMLQLDQAGLKLAMANGTIMEVICNAYAIQE